MRIFPRQYWRNLRWAVGLEPFFGAHKCPCCGSRCRKFLRYGNPPRLAQCPRCGSLERHRLVYLYMSQATDLFDGARKRMLHFAPERELSRIFRTKEYIDYVGADLFPRDTHTMKIDVTEIPFPDNSLDVIYCSHVLEHVPNDRKGISEIARVLKPDGWAILQVPITAETTFEDPSVDTPEERLRLFGQSDHVRRYGPDYVDRLVEAGLTVKSDNFAIEMDDEPVQKHGLPREPIFFCRKNPDV